MAVATPHAEPSAALVGDKGLKRDAIGYLSNLVIGVASTAPAYSLAATLGFIVAVPGMGLHAPAVLLVSFIPILLIAFGYKFLNRADPDCGTTFAWGTRAMGPYIGWINGWAIFVADVIVMASLSVIASTYTYLLFGWSGGANSTFWILVGSTVWIALMTWICWRGIELSARVQQFLLAAEIAVLAAFAIVAIVKVYANAPANSVRISADWFNPFALGIQAAGRRDPARHLHLLGLGLGRGGQRGDRKLGRGARAGGCAVDADPARDLPRRLGGRAVVRRHRPCWSTTRTTSCACSGQTCSARRGTSC